MKRLAAALLLVFAAPAAAQIETVTVDANAMVGAWRVGGPGQFSMSLLGGNLSFPPGDVFCRIEQSQGGLTVHCMNFGTGTVSIDGDHLHLAWGGMLTRLVFDATLQSVDHFTGRWALKLSGIEHDIPDVLSGEKLNLPDVPDKGGKSALLAHLLDEMGKGMPAEAFDSHANIQPPTPDALRPLGPVQLLRYMGQTQKRQNDKNRNVVDFLAVYDVEFANGERICGLHQRDDGVLDGFRCV